MYNKQKVKKVRAELNREFLYKYFVIHRMSVQQVADMYHVSACTIRTIIKERKFNIEEEREKSTAEPPKIRLSSIYFKYGNGRTVRRKGAL